MKKNNIIVNFIVMHKVSYAVGFVFLFLSSYVTAQFPRVLGNAIDILKVNKFDVMKVKLNILYMLIIAATIFVATYFWRNLVIGNGRKLENYIRELLFQHLQQLSPEFYNRKKTGDLIAYAINDINAVRMTFGPATAMTVNGIVISVTSIYSMFTVVNWRLTLISLVPIPFIVIFMVKAGITIRQRFRKVQECFSLISDRVQENINGIRVIKAYVQEEQEVERFEKLNEQMKEANIRMVQISSILRPTIEICFSVSFVLNLILGGNMVLNSTISLGEFIAFNTYLTIIMAPIISIGRIINIFQRGMASYKRLTDIIDEEPDVTDGAALANNEISGNIEIKDLSFRYPGAVRNSLNNINLTIPKGHTVGIIGRTGSGKSSIANVLLKLFNVRNGKILLDGIDINDYKLKTLRKGFSLVPQDNFLFSATIKENIAFFMDSYSKQNIENAAKLSCIYNSIMKFEHGFDTVIGERGVNLSGGQKQRISIARAIIRDPSVLILDDALSAVDTITEAEILANLKTLRENRTTIVIAHKISSVAEADEIIVMDNGAIVERGSHEELLKFKGVYYDIYKEQEKDSKRNIL
ncbi:ABC transporter ATP-binding protein [Clostridium oryzae]|uniref:Putative multidrug resistance ABC transporter ATP-binding/permease protein YheI n=1 Tax=Clostridium oryzae TaxID=1450648 RepID=A0A1V4IR90_9CLOT|nr:ABC transporter ATP-binding protein [Clostridium oryzae]OPJ62399.1 putative multidrug resistance ABC transporter ATP-binding/permease protein YheI [Clostridium oryzae]